MGVSLIQSAVMAMGVFFFFLVMKSAISLRKAPYPLWWKELKNMRTSPPVRCNQGWHPLLPLPLVWSFVSHVAHVFLPWDSWIRDKLNKKRAEGCPCLVPWCIRSVVSLYKKDKVKKKREKIYKHCRFPLRLWGFRHWPMLQVSIERCYVCYVYSPLFRIDSSNLCFYKWEYNHVLETERYLQ